MNDTRFNSDCVNSVKERNKFSELIECKGANLEEFAIDEDGYRIKIVIPGENISIIDICRVADEIDFEGFIVNDLLYCSNGVEAVLVPITQTTMNDFVWNYVNEFLEAHGEIDALMIALGVLERMIEVLPREIRNEYDKYCELVFN